MTRKTIHVSPHEDGWQVKKGGAKRALKILPKKTEVEKVGRAFAKKQKAELVIHNKGGIISQSNSYGNDPNPPKDKK